MWDQFTLPPSSPLSSSSFSFFLLPPSLSFPPLPPLLPLSPFLSSLSPYSSRCARPLILLSLTFVLLRPLFLPPPHTYLLPFLFPYPLLIYTPSPPICPPCFLPLFLYLPICSLPLPLFLLPSLPLSLLALYHFSLSSSTSIPAILSPSAIPVVITAQTWQLLMALNHRTQRCLLIHFLRVAMSQVAKRLP